VSKRSPHRYPANSDSPRRPSRLCVSGRAYLASKTDGANFVRAAEETAAMKSAFTQQGGNATLIIFGLKNAGRAPAGEEDEWAEKSEVKHSGAIGTFD